MNIGRSRLAWVVGSWLLATSAAQAQDPVPTQPPGAPAADPPSPPAAAEPSPAQPAPPPPPSYPEASQPAPPASKLGKEEPEIEPPPDPIFGDRPRREGFTLELGLGLGITRVAVESLGSEVNVGLAPLSLSLGGFLSSDLALMARMAGTSWFEEVGDGDAQIGAYFYGIALQYYLSDAGFVGGGVGYGLLALNPFFSRSASYESEGGLAFTVRGGYAVYTSRNHWLGFTLELFPEFFDNVTTLGTAINFQWQLL
jgi:hypothetical protein